MEMKHAAILFVMLVGTNVFASDADKSWSQAHVYYPETAERRTVKDLAGLTKSYPVVIYMHGCSGIRQEHDAKWAQALAQRGYVVVQPDSFARNGRVSNCDSNTKQPTNAFREWAEYREQEIDYAIEQVRSSTWGKSQSVFLMGQSEGAIATALHADAGFNARVIMSWTCTSKQYSKYDGLRGPKNIPVLTINNETDPWFSGTPFDGKCADKADGIQVTAVVIPKHGHGTYGQKQVEAVDKFFKSNTK
jgi:dienelactone hydrolase